MLYELREIATQTPYHNGLNPCFVGKCSTSSSAGEEFCKINGVLILVLLENALRVTIEITTVEKGEMS